MKKKRYIFHFKLSSVTVICKVVLSVRSELGYFLNLIPLMHVECNYFALWNSNSCLSENFTDFVSIDLG